MDKFTRLFLYLAAEKLLDSGYASLDEILETMYHIDFAAYAKLGEPLTDATWIKTSTSPKPKDWPSRMQTIREETALVNPS